MCGILGIIGHIPCKKELIEGLKALRYRGYDSCGVSLWSDSMLTYHSLNDPSSLLEDIPTQQDSNIGIAHTRWATHGQVTLKNAHPQTYQGQISVVHNGIITNFLDIKKELIAKGYRFSSETDTECIALLLYKYLSKYSVNQALKCLNERLEGRYAIACLSVAAPNEILVLRQGMPLYISQSKQALMISSDIHAFDQANQFAAIPDQTPIRLNQSGSALPLQWMKMPAFIHPKNLGSKIHTLSEVYEQPEIIKRLYTQWLQAKVDLGDPNHIIILGCGSSYHSGLIFQYWLRQSNIRCDVYLSSEVKDNGAFYHPSSLVIVISQSGETADTILALAQFKDAKKLAICNMDHSSLTQHCDLKFLLNAGLEIGVASTKAFTAQVTTLYFLSQLLLQQSPHSTIDIAYALSTLIQQESNLIKFAEKISQFQHLILLGRHEYHPITLEAALKFKELCYIHAEGLAIGELKHGPLAMIDESVLLIVLMPTKSNAIETAISEIKARHGQTLVIGTSPSCDLILDIPTHPLSLLIMNTVLQLLAIHTAMLKGLPVDQPRNLAKCVTVE
ncbi:glutamine--fructose-6-phosphate transaminase (isomerizing) [Gammaproteobacteria bacterium]|nr:glutamine--fructose-6-phosphate transaminase (isomerizing) [Gammaproteobacteria bacterium]